MSFGQLGDITFEASAEKVRTWTDLRRTGPARWVEHDVYGAKPVREFLGPGLSTIHMVVRLDINRGVVPRDELRALRQMRDTGVVSQFTIGGELVGDYSIEDLDEDLHRLDAKGVLITGIVGISLKEYA